MNEGINYKLIFGTIILVIVLYFGVNFILNRAFNKDSGPSTPTNTNSSSSSSGGNPSSSSSGGSSSGSAPTTGTESDLTNLTPSSKAAVLADQIKKAEASAKTLRGDIVLYNLTVNIPIDFALGKSKETYAYGADAEKEYWYTVSISEDSDKFVRAIIPKEDYLGTTLQPIQTKYWTLNYIEAFQKAEAGGGLAFRQKYSVSSISASLSQGDPKAYLWWIVTYTDNTGGILKIRINASSGEIVDENGDPISTSANKS